MIAALQPTGREPPGKRQLHLLHLDRTARHRQRAHRVVDRGAVVPGDVGDVLGGLEPALDLERGDPRRDQFGREGVGRQVLRRQEVLLRAEINVLSVANQVVGQTACLGALTAVGAPSSERFARQALAGVGHAEGAVHEHLQRHRRGPADLNDLRDRKLAGHDDPLHPERLGQRDALGARQRHLRGGVQWEVGTDPPDKPGRAHVLHEHGVDARLRHRDDHLLEVCQLVCKNERVERGIALEPAAVQRLHQPRQIPGGEIGGPGAGVEADVEAEIDGVGPVLDGRADAVPIPGGGQKFGGPVFWVGGRRARIHASLPAADQCFRPVSSARSWTSRPAR